MFNIHSIIKNKPGIDLPCVINISDIFNLHRIINNEPDVDLSCVILIRVGLI